MAANNNDDRIVSYFNQEHKTSYTKADIDGIYWLCDIYKLKTADGISYAHNCHTCGKNIDNVGNEFCCPNCKMTHNMQNHFPDYVCFWGKECKICTQAYKTNGSNYSDYELESDEIEEETYDDLEYSDDVKQDAEDAEDAEDEDEPILSLKNPRDDPLTKPTLERTSNYISSDEDDVLLSMLPINNRPLKENEENMVDLVIRLFSLPNK